MIYHKNDYIDELVIETEDYRPDYIKFEDTEYFLTENLECKVELNNGNYIISNVFLDLLVWGDTMDEAIEAFSFSFDSLVKNYLNEENKNLSKESIELKLKLLSLIKI